MPGMRQVWYKSRITSQVATIPNSNSSTDSVILLYSLQGSTSQILFQLQLVLQKKTVFMHYLNFPIYGI